MPSSMPGPKSAVTGKTEKHVYRRRFPRRRMKNSIGILVHGIYKVTSSLEVGEGGLLFQSPETFPVGTSVVVNFFVPGRNFIAVRAQVIYSRDHESGSKTAHGVKFIEIPFESRRMIRDYIADKTAMEEI